MKVYFDNAATTQIDKRVVDEMCKIMSTCYGNPSSIHSHGREARTHIEKNRKKIASLLNVSPGEIFFTSGGTEADNMALSCPVFDLNVNHIITSEIEHHAVLHTVERLESLGLVKVSYVNLKNNGEIDLDDLEDLLNDHANDKILVSLMHANNEIGTLLDLYEVGRICKTHNALFHTDTVQTMGHLPLDFKGANVHFASASAHKFNGPKGAGFIYIDSEIKLKPYISGGSQERNMRGGTENIYGIVGLTKALEIAFDEMDEQSTKIQDLKSYFKQKLEDEIPDIRYNGQTEPGKSLYTVLNVSFPQNPNGEMMLFSLDINGISASGGSACSSGSNAGSHVLNTLQVDPSRTNIRFSFGKFNTKEEVDFTISKIKEILETEVSIDA